MELNQTFRRRATPMLPAGAAPVEIYLLAQHHGLPTRLLDWTVHALAALLFAAADGETSQLDGGVFIWRPRTLTVQLDRLAEPLRSELRAAPCDMRSSVVGRLVSMLFGGEREQVPSLVIPIVPDALVGRIARQGACFTLHFGDPPEIPLDGTVVVRGDAKLKILDQLRMLGMSWSTLFPDLDNLCRDMRSDYKLA